MLGILKQSLAELLVLLPPLHTLPALTIVLNVAAAATGATATRDCVGAPGMHKLRICSCCWDTDSVRGVFCILQTWHPRQVPPCPPLFTLLLERLYKLCKKSICSQVRWCSDDMLDAILLHESLKLYLN